MPPCRIAYVLGIFPKLSETFIAAELAELRRRRVDLRILSLLRPRETMRHELIAHAGLDELATYQVAQFPDVLKSFRPQLLHAHFAREATEAARSLADTLQVPFCFTAHGYDIFRKPPPDFSERARVAAAVVTVSEANAKYIQQTFGVERSHIRVIPCGVDTEAFKPSDEQLGNREAPLLIVCVARQVQVKNPLLLLQACAILMSKQIEFRCIMIGDGPLRTEVHECRRSLRLEDKVDLPGALPQEQVIKYWQKADIAVLSSHHEGMPVCLMEAGACGVPVVATRVGGIPELIEDGETGLLTSAGDAEALAAALQRLLLDPTLRIKMGHAARRRIVQRFSVSRQVDALLDLWSGICPEESQ